MRIALDRIVQLAGDAEGVEAATEDIRSPLPRVLREHHGGNGEALGAEEVHEAQDVLVIGDAQVAARLVALDVVGVDGDDDLDLAREALKHAELDVRLKAGQDTARVVIIKELAAKLEVELAAKLIDALLDARCLQLDVAVVVESGAHGGSLWGRGVWERGRLGTSVVRSKAPAERLGTR